jgi:hypothetical protein
MKYERLLKWLFGFVALGLLVLIFISAFAVREYIDKYGYFPSVISVERISPEALNFSYEYGIAPALFNARDEWVNGDLTFIKRWFTDRAYRDETKAASERLNDLNRYCYYFFFLANIRLILVYTLPMFRTMRKFHPFLESLGYALRYTGYRLIQ